METLGFKNLTIENWLQPDDVVLLFKRLSPSDKAVHDISGEEWTTELLVPKLIPEVPQEIRKLFEVARGAMIYGFFFYPLYALGVEQLARIAEAALTFKCQQIKAPNSISSFKEKIGFLCEKKIITEAEKESWDGMRKFRNESSHPKDQNILPPGMAIKILFDIARRINDLYSNAQT